MARDGEHERHSIPARIMRWLPYDQWCELHTLIKDEALHYTVGSTSVSVYARKDGSLDRMVRDILREYGRQR